MPILNRLLDTLIPPICICCGKRLLSGEKYICFHCQSSLPLTTFSKGNQKDNEMARKLWGKTDVENAVAIYRYIAETPFSNIIHDMKYAHNKSLCHYMGQAMGKRILDTDIANEADVLIPIPITGKRRRQRGYNQSEELCKGINAITSIPYEFHVLKRNNFSISQTQLDSQERENNVANAFSLIHPELVTGKHVVLVDDIFTTGSTTRACAKLINELAETKVSILTLAMAKG